jgi:hypothetical protein
LQFQLATPITGLAPSLSRKVAPQKLASRYCIGIVSIVQISFKSVSDERPLLFFLTLGS